MIRLEFIRAIRRVIRAPRFALAVVASVGIAVGPMLISFSVFEAVFLRNMNAKTPERLVTLHSVRGERGQRAPVSRGLSFPDFEDLRTALPRDAWRYITAWKKRDVTAITGTGEQAIRIALVAGDYFRIADARFIHGYPTEDRETGIVVTRALQTRIGGESANASLTIQGERFEIGGVVDDDFHGLYANEGIDAWIPLSELPRLDRSANVLAYRELEDLSVVVESTADANVEAFAPLAAAVGRGLMEFHGGERFAWHVESSPARTSMRALLRTREGQVAAAPLLVMLCILLIAATNVANLFVIRGAARATELRLRLALGLTRPQLAVQEAFEPLILGVCGLAFGLWTGLIALPRLADLPALARLDLRSSPASVLAACAAAMIFVALAASMRALSIGRLHEAGIVHAGQGITGHGVSRMQRAFLVTQFTLALAFTCVAVQLAAAVRQQSAVDVGFDTGRLFVVNGAIGADGRTPDQWLSDLERVMRELRAVPEVVDVSASVAEFFGGYGMSRRPLSTTPGEDPVGGQTLAAMDVVSPGYFTALGLPLRAGREFGAMDRQGGPSRIVVNETLARRVGGGRDAIGMILYESGTYPLEIIGVVPDIRATASEETQPAYYRAFSQSPLPSFVLYVRAASASPALQSALPTAIARALPQSLGRLRVQTAESQRQARDLPAITMLWLSIALAVLAMSITGLGLFGIASYAAMARMREFGMRAALGASPRNLATIILGDGLAWTAAAAVLSMPFSWVGMRVATTLVVGARPIPLLTQSIVIALYVLVVCVSLSVPAYRAASVDPADALRSA